MYKFSNQILRNFGFFQEPFSRNVLPYTVGALLYSPALNPSLFSMIQAHKIKEPYSLAICLEDTISDAAIPKAISQIVSLFQRLGTYAEKGKLQQKCLPKLFIRVRNPQQVVPLFQKLRPYQEFLTGFIFPKYTVSCSQAYLHALMEVNTLSKKTIYMMPILESEDLLELSSRPTLLSQLKQELLPLSPYILNIRVGGNDFCHCFGLRRHFDETIYDMLPVASILVDILTTFSRDFVVSGPVWEYFSGTNSNWHQGFLQELKKDRQNGFIGKTVIHPNQIAWVNASLQVKQSDLKDAIDILSCSEKMLLVKKSAVNERMNEMKTHTKWAEKTLILAGIYGVIDDETLCNRRMCTNCKT